MDRTAFLIDPTNKSIKKENAANNSDVFRIIGGTFLSKRTPDNNLIHYLRYPSSHEVAGFHIKAMSLEIIGPGLITGSRPFRDSPFDPVNFSDLNILYEVLFLTQCPDNSGFVVSHPKHFVRSLPCG